MSCRHTFTAPDKSFAISKEDRPHFLQEISSSSTTRLVLSYMVLIVFFCPDFQSLLVQNRWSRLKVAEALHYKSGILPEVVLIPMLATAQLLFVNTNFFNIDSIYI